MSEFPFHVARIGSPANGTKQVAFDHKCQVIPEGDCAELRKLLSLCPTRAQSPPIAGSSSQPGNLIARAISPQFVRSISPQLLKKASGLGNAPPANSSTSWRTRLASWGSNTDSSSHVSNLAAAAGPSSLPNDAGPRLVAPVPARGAAAPMIPYNNDDIDQEDDSVELSPSNESVDFDDIHTEFQNAAFKVAMNQHHLQVESLRAASPAFPPSRSPSPFVPRNNINGVRDQRPDPCNRPKSCLVIRSKTPQAPGPPPLTGDGMTALRATRSNDRDVCLMRRRRAEGVPVVCPSPLSSPENERGPSGWGDHVHGQNHAAKSRKAAAAAPTEKQSKLSRWRRFRRAASEEAHHAEPSSSPSTLLDPHMDEAAIKREIQAGRWPFEAPLNVECSCKNCQSKIEVGLSSDYEPKWTRAARIRWLEAQEDAAAQSRAGSCSATASGLPRSTSRTAIQADKVAQLHNETVHPMTAAELAAEPTCPITEQGEAAFGSTAEAIAAAAVTTKPPNPTGLEEGDDTLRSEILARRQRQARQSPVLRHGARSMLRQIEEAERIEKEAARQRSQSRDSHLSCGNAHGNASGSGRCSPASPAMSPSLPSTPESVSNYATPQERQATDGQSGNASYFALAAPPERVRSPLIPADEAAKPRYARPIATVATDPTTLSMGSVAQSLEALASPTATPASCSPSASPESERR